MWNNSDSRSNIVQENRNGKVTTYTYDALGYLIRVVRPRREHTFQVVLQLHHGNAGGSA